MHIARDLRALGHRVDCVQEQPGRSTSMLTQIERRCRTARADLLLFTRTWGLPDGATALWRRLEAAGTTTASYHLDLYLGLARKHATAAEAAEQLVTDSFWTTQHVFTPDGDPGSAVWFAEHGINHHWSPPAIVSDECVPGQRSERFDYDVVFVGSENYHPEWPWRPLLISALRDAFGDRFRRFAGDCPEGPIRGAALNDLYATAKVVVGDSLALPARSNYWTDRYYETIGRGGFLIAPNVPGIEQHFTDEQHFVSYDHPTSDDPINVARALEDVLYLARIWAGASQANRDSIRLTGQEHIRANHTYKHRLAAAIDTMKILPRDRRIVTTSAQARSTRDVIRAREGKPPTPPPQRAFFAIDRLELGSGYHPTPGFVHLDINPAAPGVDIVGPAFPLDILSDTVGEIRAVDVLEHLSYRDTITALREWARVLRSGGRLYVQVPDAGRIMEAYGLRDEVGLVEDMGWLVQRIPPELPQTPIMGAVWRLLGGHADGDNGRDDFRWNAHYALFDRDHLSDCLSAAGLEIQTMESNEHPNLCVWAVKP